MTDIKLKKQRYADKENLKKLMKYIKATFANNNEINEEFYTKEQIDTKLEGISGGTGGGGSTGGGTCSDCYTKSEIDTKLNLKANTSDLSNYFTKSEVVNLLSNYYTKEQIDIMLNNMGSDKYGMSITADESEGGNDTQGGLSFWNAVERAPGYDGTSQMNIVEDSNTVEDE